MVEEVGTCASDARGPFSGSHQAKEKQQPNLMSFIVDSGKWFPWQLTDMGGEGAGRAENSYRASPTAD